MNKIIVILGSVPPPTGGVTVHVKRLLENLDKRKVNYHYFDIRPSGNKLSMVLYFKTLLSGIKKSRNGIMHYQLNNMKEAFFITFFIKFFHFKMIYTVHSFPEDLEDMNYIKRKCFYALRKKIPVFIAPSLHIKKKLMQNGVNPEKIYVLNTYIKPEKKEYDAAIRDDLKKYFNTDKPVILSSASRLYKKHGIDIYGVDMCLDACIHLKGKVRFLVCIPYIDDYEYYNEILKKVEQNSLEDDFIIYAKEVNLIPLYKYSAIFVRPTFSDSYGISVAEAVDAGIPVIASNVCERADGCILFEKRNLNNFVNQINKVLSGNRTKMNAVNNSCIDALLGIYQTI